MARVVAWSGEDSIAVTATCVWSSGRQVLAQLISTEQAKTMEMFGAGQRAPPAAPPHQVADALSPSMLKHLLKAEGGAAEGRAAE